MRVDSVWGLFLKRVDLEFNVCKDRLSPKLVDARIWHILYLCLMVCQAYVCGIHERATPLMGAWYESPNLIAALSGFLIAAVPAGFTARYALKGKITEINVGHTEKSLSSLLSAHDNFIKDLRAELADKSQQIKDLQSGRAHLYKDVDDLHAIRQAERRAYQQQMTDMESKVDEALDKLHVSQRQAKDCEIKCNELQFRIENLEKRIARQDGGPA